MTAPAGVLATRHRVGVVIANWNGRRHLLDCLASLERCEPGPDVVAVVDQGSADGSAQAVRDRFPAVRLLELGENVGFAAANNLGARSVIEAGCTAVLFLNNDTLVEPGALSEMLSALDEPGVELVNPRITDAAGRPWFSGAAPRAWRADIPHDRAELDPSLAPREIGSASGCALLMRAGTAARYGPFDEAYFAYWEDADLSARVRRDGGRAVLAPAAHVRHLVSADALRNTPAGFFYYVNARNRLLYWSRRLSRPAFALVAAVYLVGFAAPRAAALVLLGRGAKARALLLGCADFFRGRFGRPEL
jgi:GT2 family glycosyltransferase